MNVPSHLLRGLGRHPGNSANFKRSSRVVQQGVQALAMLSLSVLYTDLRPGFILASAAISSAGVTHTAWR